MLRLQLLHALPVLRLSAHRRLVTPPPIMPARPSSLPTSSSSSSSLLWLSSPAGLLGAAASTLTSPYWAPSGAAASPSRPLRHAPASTDRQRQSAVSPRRRRKPSLHRPVSRPERSGTRLARSFKRHRCSHDREYNRAAVVALKRLRLGLTAARRRRRSQHLQLKSLPIRRTCARLVRERRGAPASMV